MSELSHHERITWVEETGALIGQSFIRKYQAGQAEHGRDLGEVSVDKVLDEGVNESLDQLAYLHEIKRRVAGKVLIDRQDLAILLRAAADSIDFPLVDVEIQQATQNLTVGQVANTVRSSFKSYYESK
jgi:hypothetical protein